MLDIELLLSETKLAKRGDVNELVKQITKASHELGRHGEVKVRKLTADELKALQKRPVNTYDSIPRYKEPKRYLRPITVKAGVVMKLLERSTDACDFIERLSQHYGGIFISYKKADEIAYNAYVRQSDTDITF